MSTSSAFLPTLLSLSFFWATLNKPVVFTSGLSRFVPSSHHHTRIALHPLARVLAKGFLDFEMNRNDIFDRDSLIIRMLEEPISGNSQSSDTKLRPKNATQPKHTGASAGTIRRMLS